MPLLCPAVTFTTLPTTLSLVYDLLVNGRTEHHVLCKRSQIDCTHFGSNYINHSPLALPLSLCIILATHHLHIVSHLAWNLHKEFDVLANHCFPIHICCCLLSLPPRIQKVSVLPLAREMHNNGSADRSMGSSLYKSDIPLQSAQKTYGDETLGRCWAG